MKKIVAEYLIALSKLYDNCNEYSALYKEIIHVLHHLGLIKHYSFNEHLRSNQNDGCIHIQRQKYHYYISL